MVDAQTIGVLVTAASVTVAAIYYSLTLRINQRNIKTTLETRQTQLFMEVYKTDKSKDFWTIWWEIIGNWEWTDLDDFLKKCGPYSGNSVPYGKLMSIFSHYEGMSVLMRRSLLSPDLVYELNYDSIIMFWDKFSPIVQGWRKRYNAPQMFGSIEWLYGEMKRIRESKGHGYDYASYMKMPTQVK